MTVRRLAIAVRFLGCAACVALALSSFSACRTAPTASVHAAQSAPSAVRRVVLVTIDGLMPDVYLRPDALGLAVPTLRRFVAEGAYSEGTLSVFPSVTYPAHTSIATGVRPSRHGIYTNRSVDPFERSYEAWNWYAEDLRAKPLWTAARERGLSTALVNWPVSVGARVDYLVPEIWRAKIPEDIKLTRALSTPGLLEAANARFPELWSRFVPPKIRDEGGADVAVHLLESVRPTLLMLHIFDVDGAQHGHGILSPEARASIEGADRQLARIFEALDRAGTLAETAVVVASDHGFSPITRQLHPGALLREAGLVTLDAKGRVSDYRVHSHAVGGAAYVYLRDADDREAEQTARSLLSARLGSGIARVFGREEIAAMGGDPGAVLALEAELGASFGNGYLAFETPAPNVATHGYHPERPEMQASLLWLGPGLARGVLRGSRLIDVAPTVASWLGIPLGEVEGRVLP
jgi:predicted AlkP superfamily pyrophosphatase or phosphodiesterase